MNDTPADGALSHEDGHGPAHDTFSQRRAMLAGLGGLAAGAFMARSAQAGPLSPPPGPIEPTPGPEPRIPINQENTPGNGINTYLISQPGSYYLTENLLGEPGKSGIRIESNNVTLDLMGFECLGVADSLTGIDQPAFLPGITIRNGTVSGWGQDGIFARIDSGLIEGVHAHSNGGSGIRALGRSVIVRACSAYANDFSGINVSQWSTIESCTAIENGSVGIECGGNSLITGCTAVGNGEGGIKAQLGCVVTGCSARGNLGSGIEVRGRCLVLNNNLISNTSGPQIGAGILAFAGWNRLDGNNCALNQVGISCPQPTNILARNTCSQNATNWDIASGNHCLVISAAAGGAISGNSGGVSLGSTDPNANYTH